MSGTDDTIDSTADERSANNAMRHQYRVLSDAEKELVGAVKDAGDALLRLIGEAGRDRETGTSRELSIAKTKTEEAVMWAVKHITGPR